MIVAVDPADLSLFQLRCFLTVVDAGSFVEAGRRLGLSTSVVSKTLARLETVHGIKLLHRSTHAVSLTEDARPLVAPAREAAQALELVAQRLDATRASDAGWVRLTAPIAFLRHCLMPLLPALRHAHPGLCLDLRASNDLVDLASHGIDVALRTGSLDKLPGHVQQLWFTCPWVVCAAPGYLAGRQVPTTPEHLAGHDLIGFRASDDGLVRSWRFLAPGSGALLRWVPDPTLVIDDGEAGWRATLDGFGIARAPLFLAAEALRAGTVVELLRPWRDAAMPVSIVRRDTRLVPPRVEQLIAFLKRHPPLLDVA